MAVKTHVPAEHMLVRMMRQVAIAMTLLSLATPAAGDTIYKYRRADGRVVYSSEAVPGATLLETFEYVPPPPRPPAQAQKQRLDDEERIRAQLAALERAWNDVQEARRALAAAEGRRRAGVEPQEGEAIQLAGPSSPAPPAVGGPQAPASPAVGGPQTPASPAVGGPLGTRHGGGGRSPEYAARMAQLDEDVTAAQARYDDALRRYNALR